MTTASTQPARVAAPPKYDNGAEWLHALGDIPLERVVFNPWPGTATEKDLLEFVERDKRLVELIDGTLVEKPVGHEESQIAMMLGYFLVGWVRSRQLGAVTGEAGTLRMKRGRIRLPDVAFVSAERLAALPKPRPSVPAIGPDLAVEVLSESNTRSEIAQKLSEYFESGTRLAWIIDPATRTAAVYEGPTDQPSRVVREHEMLDGGAVLPGFAVLLSDIFVAPES